MTVVIATDPGLTCGWAMIDLDTIGSWDPGRVSSGQAPADDWCDWCMVNVNRGCVLIVERFTVTARTAQLSPQPEPMEVIGVLKFIARRAQAQLELQTPASAKRFVTDSQLRKIGLWRPGQDHARDAIRHLILGISSHVTGQMREELLQSLA